MRAGFKLGIMFLLLAGCVKSEQGGSQNTSTEPQSFSINNSDLSAYPYCDYTEGKGQRPKGCPCRNGNDCSSNLCQSLSYNKEGKATSDFCSVNSITGVYKGINFCSKECTSIKNDKIECPEQGYCIGAPWDNYKCTINQDCASGSCDGGKCISPEDKSGQICGSFGGDIVNGDINFCEVQTCANIRYGEFQKQLECTDFKQQCMFSSVSAKTPSPAYCCTDDHPLSCVASSSSPPKNYIKLPLTVKWKYDSSQKKIVIDNSISIISNVVWPDTIDATTEILMPAFDYAIRFHLLPYMVGNCLELNGNLAVIGGSRTLAGATSSGGPCATQYFSSNPNAQALSSFLSMFNLLNCPKVTRARLKRGLSQAHMIWAYSDIKSCIAENVTIASRAPNPFKPDLYPWERSLNGHEFGIEPLPNPNWAGTLSKEILSLLEGSSAWFIETLKKYCIKKYDSNLKGLIGSGFGGLLASDGGKQQCVSGISDELNCKNGCTYAIGQQFNQAILPESFSHMNAVNNSCSQLTPQTQCGVDAGVKYFPCSEWNSNSALRTEAKAESYTKQLINSSCCPIWHLIGDTLGACNAAEEK